MLIQILQKREGGTDIPLGRKEWGNERVYEFRPNDKGDHVCDVDEELDANVLLAQENQFVTYDPAPKKKPVLADPPQTVDEYAFLDELSGKDLEDYAFEKLHAKLDESHDDAKRREYLKGVLKLKG